MSMPIIKSGAITREKAVGNSESDAAAHLWHSANSSTAAFRFVAHILDFCKLSGFRRLTKSF